MRDITKELPDFVNAAGVRWWLEPGLTRYATSKGLNNEVRIWTVERPDGHKTRLLTEHHTVLAEDQTLEGIGLKIDLMAFNQNMA